MANQYFQFKEFIIQQDACGMKVTTDGCLFGAWAASLIQSINPQQILDIGTGTGLLSLMLAQQTTATIDAVEIDEAAAVQANQNVSSSKWKQQITVHQTNILNYSSNIQYDFIVTNPPFFVNDLRSNDAKRNLAMHSSHLSLIELLNCINNLLSPKGFLAILLPAARSDYFESIANNFYIHQKITVQQTNQHTAFRAMYLLSKTVVEHSLEETIVIKNSEQNYTVDFIQLLKAYYLKL